MARTEGVSEDNLRGGFGGEAERWQLSNVRVRWYGNPEDGFVASSCEHEWKWRLEFKHVEVN